MKYSISPTYDRLKIARRFERVLWALNDTAPLMRRPDEVVATVEAVGQEHVQASPQQLTDDERLVTEADVDWVLLLHCSNIRSPSDGISATRGTARAGGRRG